MARGNDAYPPGVALIGIAPVMTPPWALKARGRYWALSTNDEVVAVGMAGRINPPDEEAHNRRRRAALHLLGEGRTPEGDHGEGDNYKGGRTGDRATEISFIRPLPAPLGTDKPNFPRTALGTSSPLLHVSADTPKDFTSLSTGGASRKTDYNLSARPGGQMKFSMTHRRRRSPGLASAEDLGGRPRTARGEAITGPVPGCGLQP